MSMFPGPSAAMFAARFTPATGMTAQERYDYANPAMNARKRIEQLVRDRNRLAMDGGYGPKVEARRAIEDQISRLRPLVTNYQVDPAAVNAERARLGQPALTDADTQGIQTRNASRAAEYSTATEGFRDQLMKVARERQAEAERTQAEMVNERNLNAAMTRAQMEQLRAPGLNNEMTQARIAAFRDEQAQKSKMGSLALRQGEFALSGAEQDRTRENVERTRDTTLRGLLANPLTRGAAMQMMTPAERANFFAEMAKAQGAESAYAATPTPEEARQDASIQREANNMKRTEELDSLRAAGAARQAGMVQLDPRHIQIADAAVRLAANVGRDAYASDSDTAVYENAVANLERLSAALPAPQREALRQYLEQQFQANNVAFDAEGGRTSLSNFLSSRVFERPNQRRRDVNKRLQERLGITIRQ